jgi:hypothetical protein
MLKGIFKEINEFEHCIGLKGMLLEYGIKNFDDLNKENVAIVWEREDEVYFVVKDKKAGRFLTVDFFLVTGAEETRGDFAYKIIGENVFEAMSRLSGKPVPSAEQPKEAKELPQQVLEDILSKIKEELKYAPSPAMLCQLSKAAAEVCTALKEK